MARVKSMGEIGGRTGVRFVRGSGEIGERVCRLERGGLICACFGVKSVSELGARRFDLVISDGVLCRWRCLLVRLMGCLVFVVVGCLVTMGLIPWGSGSSLRT